MKLHTILDPLSQIDESRYDERGSLYPDRWDEIQHGDPKIISVVLKLYQEAYEELLEPDDDQGYMTSSFDAVKAYEILEAFKNSV